MEQKNKKKIIKAALEHATSHLFIVNKSQMTLLSHGWEIQIH